MIQVFKPDIGEQEIEAVAKVLRSGWIGLGPTTERLEQEFARRIGVKHAVALNSCTAALHLALEVLGVGPGDEVIVPTITFVSTAHAVVYTGAKPIFADVVNDTLNIDIADIHRKITKRTKVILPVHYGGHPCDMDEIRELAREHGIEVVEDAAHACGATYKGRNVGTLSDLTCFSFHAVKNLTTGEGGMLTTNNAEWDKQLRQLRWLGINKDTWTRTETEEGEIYAWRYSVERLGYKYHMNDIAAALGLVQLERLAELNGRRRYIAERYNEGLSDLNEITLPVERPYVRSSFHIYPIQLDRRDALIGFLKSHDIAPGVHYYPIHLYPYYRDERIRLPVAEQVWQRELSLPMHPGLSDSDIDKIIETIRKFCKQ